MAIVTIVGAGMMGSALAFPARENGHEVRLVGTHLDRQIIDTCKATDRHPKFTRDFPAGVQYYQIEDLDRAMELAKEFGLPLKKKITSLSTGYASIFRLVLGLSVNTPYILFDEPVLGLDAQHRDLFYRLLIEKYSQEPCTILISTHLIAEVEHIVDHTIILREGKILRDAPTDELMEDTYALSGPAGMVDQYAEGKNILSSHTLGGLKTVSIQGTPDTNLPIGLEVSPMSLQDYFISLQEACERKEKGQ